MLLIELCCDLTLLENNMNFEKEAGATFRFNFLASPQPAAPEPVKQVANEVTLLLGEEVPITDKDGSVGLVDEMHVPGLPFPLYKSRISDDAAAHVTGNAELKRSDLVSGVYEGGFKLWECSLDLCQVIAEEAGLANRSLSSIAAGPSGAYAGAAVLELGCGHALPGIVAALAGARVCHLQDYNPEVVRGVTVGNVRANMPKLPASWPRPAVRYFSGDWGSLAGVLTSALASDSAAHGGAAEGYDYILTAETIYSPPSQQRLLQLVKQVLKPSGVCLVAAKTYYFGVGGGVRQFIDLVASDGAIACESVRSYNDGSSNLREVLRLTWR